MRDYKKFNRMRGHLKNRLKIKFLSSLIMNCQRMFSLKITVLI